VYGVQETCNYLSVIVTYTYCPSRGERERDLSAIEQRST